MLNPSLIFAFLEKNASTYVDCSDAFKYKTFLEENSLVDSAYNLSLWKDCVFLWEQHFSREQLETIFSDHVIKRINFIIAVKRARFYLPDADFSHPVAFAILSHDMTILFSSIPQENMDFVLKLIFISNYPFYAKEDISDEIKEVLSNNLFDYLLLRDAEYAFQSRFIKETFLFLRKYQLLRMEEKKQILNVLLNTVSPDYFLLLLENFQIANVNFTPEERLALIQKMIGISYREHQLIQYLKVFKDEDLVFLSKNLSKEDVIKYFKCLFILSLDNFGENDYFYIKRELQKFKDVLPLQICAEFLFSLKEYFLIQSDPKSSYILTILFDGDKNRDEIIKGIRNSIGQSSKNWGALLKTQMENKMFSFRELFGLFKDERLAELRSTNILALQYNDLGFYDSNVLGSEAISDEKYNDLCFYDKVILSTTSDESKKRLLRFFGFYFFPENLDTEKLNRIIVHIIAFIYAGKKTEEVFDMPELSIEKQALFFNILLEDFDAVKEQNVSSFEREEVDFFMKHIIFKANTDIFNHFSREIKAFFLESQGKESFIYLFAKLASLSMKDEFLSAFFGLLSSIEKEKTVGPFKFSFFSNKKENFALLLWILEYTNNTIFAYFRSHLKLNFNDSEKTELLKAAYVNRNGSVFVNFVLSDDFSLADIRKNIEIFSENEKYPVLRIKMEKEIPGFGKFENKEQINLFRKFKLDIMPHDYDGIFKTIFCEKIAGVFDFIKTNLFLSEQNAKQDRDLVFLENILSLLDLNFIGKDYEEDMDFHHSLIIIHLRILEAKKDNTDIMAKFSKFTTVQKVNSLLEKIDDSDFSRQLKGYVQNSILFTVNGKSKDAEEGTPLEEIDSDKKALFLN